MKPYPKNKNSGIEWIEEIPEAWSMLRLKYFMKINPSKSSTVLNENISGEVSFLPMEKVDSDGKYDVVFMKPIEEVNNGFTCFKKNDVIFAKITPCFENGKGALLDKIKTNIGFGSTEFHILRSIRNMSNPKYLYYITKTHPFRKMGEAFMSGSAGQKRVPSNFIENLFFPYSPFPEQKQIAKYLDHKTAIIDSLIEKKKKLIELLKEERTNVINQAVTKGLDPNVPMKDSGIEWLGEIPEHWKIKKIKHVADDVQTGITPPSNNSEYFDGGDINWFTPSDFNGDLVLNNSKRKITSKALSDRVAKMFPFNSVFLVGIGATLGKIGLIEKQSSCNQQINPIIFNDEFNPFYGAYFLMAYGPIIISLANASTLAILNQSQTKELLVLAPPLEEQKIIVKQIENETTRIDSIISKSEKEIELLQEYRTALISEVVTGKIDVREEKV